jgi:hypothetical protein
MVVMRGVRMDKGTYEGPLVRVNGPQSRPLEDHRVAVRCRRGDGRTVRTLE